MNRLITYEYTDEEENEDDVDLILDRDEEVQSEKNKIMDSSNRKQYKGDQENEIDIIY